MSQSGNRPLVIFGTGELAQLAYYYFKHDSPRDIAAFTLDKEFIREPSLFGQPVVEFEVIHEAYPPAKFDLFVAIGYSRLNQARAEKCKAAKSRGYQLASYISSNSIRYPDLSIGENCLIMEGTIIQPFVNIGDSVIVWSGCLISHHVEIGSNSFLAARCVISGKVKIGEFCFIGVNATLRENISLAGRTIIGAGALVLNSTEENQSYLGLPSKNSGIPSDRLQSLL